MIGSLRFGAVDPGKYEAPMYAHILTVIFLVSVSASFGQDILPAKPPGKFSPLTADNHRDARSFTQAQPVIGTTYFYWYDIDSKSHIIDHDGTDALTTHPADINNLSFKRASWHKQQLTDMIDAGIDFLMPVYWGVPGKYDGWSFVGLPPLVEAHDALLKQGVEPPQIGMFYDTSILLWNGFNKDGSSYHVDLTTDFGKQWFYTAIRDFFSLIPPAKWARIDGRPIVFLYSHTFAKAQDPAQLEYLKSSFEKDFGVKPFVVKADGWLGEADATYSWGGAVSGPLIYRRVAALGPGYDHSAVPDRTPLIVDRRDGKTYIDRWLKILALNPDKRPWMVHVETWNEWHEGTNIAHSREYGRSYIVLTRLFSDMWHARTHLRLGSYADSDKITWSASNMGRSQAKGLELAPSAGDGFWTEKTLDGTKAVVSAPNPNSQASRYLYFNVDDAFAFDLYDETVTLAVTYRDAGCSSFHLEYDNTDPQRSVRDGAFRPVGKVQIENTNKWRTVEFYLPNCRFTNRSNGADFRIAVIGDPLELSLSNVTLKRNK